MDRRIEERFWLSVNRGGNVDCWPWNGFLNPKGYGQINYCVPGLPVYAHRIAWHFVNGAIPDDLTIDHLCRNRRCCNPAHMEVVPLAENGRRGAVSRWETVGDAVSCRHGHVGERAQTRSGDWYCRACARERTARRRAEYGRPSRAKGRPPQG